MEPNNFENRYFVGNEFCGHVFKRTDPGRLFLSINHNWVLRHPMPRTHPFLIPPIMLLQSHPPLRTSADIVRSPTGTKTDFTTDVPPLVPISADQLLRDEHRMKKLTAAFCGAIFSYPDQATINRTIDESLRLCGGSEETLSTVLQTKFFADHTPFYWAIVNKDPKQVGIPPLLERLFNICNNAVDATTQGEIMWGLLGLKDPEDSLYQSIAPYIGTSSKTSSPSYFRDRGQRPTVQATTGNGHSCYARFRIPLFLDRLILDDGVCLTFVAMGSLWHFRADVIGSADWKWRFGLMEVRSRHVYSTVDMYERKVSVKLDHSTEGEPPLLCSGRRTRGNLPSAVKITIPDDDLQRLHHNPYTAKKTRELAGTLEIEDKVRI